MPTRFRLANRPKTDEEKFKNIQTKLESKISETEEKGKYVRKFALESRWVTKRMVLIITTLTLLEMFS